MPIALSIEERNVIKQKLQEAAETSLKKHGVKKTTVDNLVKSINIPKGTFYLFYPSKDLLLYEVFQTKHDEIQNEFVKRMFEIQDDITANKVTDLIFDVYKKLDSTFLMSFITSGDLELVISKLPLEVVQKHIDGDDITMDKILSIIPNVNEEMSLVYSAAMRLVMTSVLHKQEVGIDLFDAALKLSIKGIVNQIFKEVQI